LRNKASEVIRKLKGSEVYRYICETVCLELIFNKPRREEIKLDHRSSTDYEDMGDSSPEKDFIGRSSTRDQVKKLMKKVKQYETSEKSRQDYILHMSKMTEVLKKENNDLNVILEKHKLEFEKEINAKEIENNNLRKRLDIVGKSPRKEK